MALDTFLQRWSVLPRFLQYGNGEPRKAHFLGKKEATPVEGKQDQGGKQDQTPKQPGKEKYRRLDSIAIGEVKEIIDYFQPQLVPSPTDEWVAKNYFCQLPLNRNGEDRPSVVFGRVKTCFPSDGNVQNIEEMEMYFPQKHAAPDLLHLRQDDLALHKPIHSFCVGIKMYLSEAEQNDFSHSENIFIEKGFAPLYNTGYSELLDITEQNQMSLPLLYLFGSEWFASIPDSWQPDIKQQLHNLVQWNKFLLNYHPKRYTFRYRSLNDELDFNYGFSQHYLLMPQDTDQVLKKIDEEFMGILMQGMK
jgi:hypothetical protein